MMAVLSNSNPSEALGEKLQKYTNKMMRLIASDSNFVVMLVGAHV